MLTILHLLICNFIPIVFYYITSAFMSNFLNTNILCEGMLTGAVITGILLDIYDNHKVRSVFYIFNGLIAILLYRKLLINHSVNYYIAVQFLLFVFGFCFSIAVTDLIKYVRDHFVAASAVINGVFGSIMLVIAFFCKFCSLTPGLHLLFLKTFIKILPLLLVGNLLVQAKKEYSTWHFVLLSLSIVLLPLQANSLIYIILYLLFSVSYLGYVFEKKFCTLCVQVVSLFNRGKYVYSRSIDAEINFNENNVRSVEYKEKEKKNNGNNTLYKEYFTSLLNIFTNLEIYFYILFLVANTFGMRSGMSSLVLKKNAYLIPCGSAIASILYHFVLPKLSISRVTIFCLVFLNFLIYFQFFGSSIVGHILFGICGSSMFLSFIHGLSYPKHIGSLFGIFFLLQFVTGFIYDKLIAYSNWGVFLAKDLHIILLQVNKKVILHLYGYHLPLIIFSFATIVFYYINKSKFDITSA